MERVREAIAILGTERAMFATNFPAVGPRIDYHGLVRAVSRMLPDFSPQDRDRFLWRNAAAFYNL